MLLRAPSSLHPTTPAVILGCALLSTPARAEGPEPVRLSWVRGQGADGCSSEPQIAGQVTARLGRSPFAADAARSIDAYVTRGEGGWRAEIYVRGQDGKLAGSRELTSEAADCAPIEAASVLAIALVIDPDAIARPPPPAGLSPTGAPVASPPPGSLRVAAPPAAPPPSPSSGALLPPPLPAWVPSAAPTPGGQPSAPSRASPEPSPRGVSAVALRAGAGLGLLPGVAAGLSLAAQLGVARVVDLTGEALWMPEVRASDPRFAFGLSAFGLGACVEVVRRQLADLAACGALWGGAVHAVVFSLTPVGPGQRPWVGAEVSPRLRLHLAPRLHVELGAHLLVPLVRQPFTVIGFARPVFQQTPVTALPFVGLGTTFP